MVQFFQPGDPTSLSERIVYAYQHWDVILEQKNNFHKFTDQFNWELISGKYVELVSNLADRAFG